MSSMIQRRRHSEAARIAIAAAVFVLCLALSATVASALQVELDDGFESGTDGALLTTGPWTLLPATPEPARLEYDTLRVKAGTVSGWVQGPGTNAYSGVTNAESAGMWQDGAEMTFWVYLDTTTDARVINDNNGVFELRWDAVGNISLYLQARSPMPEGYGTEAAGYRTVGTYQTGWTQYRVTYNFTADTITLSSRRDAADPWTPIKASAAPDYNIPMRNNTDRVTSGPFWMRAHLTGNLWVDDVWYTDHTPPVIAASVSDGGSYTAPATITFSSDDAAEGPIAASATLDGAAFTNGAAVSAPGSHTLVVTSTDSSGNAATKTVTFTIAAPPVVSTPASSSWSLAVLLVLGSAVTAVARRRRTAASV